MKSIRLILITLLLFLLIGNSVLAATGVYTIGWALTASGGGIRESEGYRTRDIIGQTAAGLSSSEDYLLYSGFYGPYQPEEPIAVGGEVYPVNKGALLVPWIALAAAIIIGAAILVRRRKAHSWK